MQNKPLHVMFTAVPPRYDLINRIITWGLDKRWRLMAARECLKSSPKRILDLCCGTGDLAIHLAQLADYHMELIGLDYSPPMLEIAAKKAERLATGRKITFVHGDAAELPFPDGHFDCIGISFAFRNLTYRNPLVQRHLAEVLRVLKQGGRFVIVETSQPKARLIRKLFHLYLRWFVFRVGYLLSGNRGAYSYLAESAARFYTANELQGILLEAGFREISARPLLFGATAIYVVIK
ncbi:MAG: bifunctional demethylmenaquinone methyltransferase/2-methoxy-6-polyprenyl-1,4-benzoquinol methylase UbiE [Chloroflexi bacterium]|nr:bifunctional demethylmenaquinone methyltransferase/2-methoxy-6-polyprenyl-1,4-benzoquinol methylase UbiE [Chloroflexota bacterium]